MFIIGKGEQQHRLIIDSGPLWGRRTKGPGWTAPTPAATGPCPAGPASRSSAEAWRWWRPPGLRRPAVRPSPGWSRPAAPRSPPPPAHTADSHSVAQSAARPSPGRSRPAAPRSPPPPDWPRRNRRQSRSRSDDPLAHLRGRELLLGVALAAEVEFTYSRRLLFDTLARAALAHLRGRELLGVALAADVALQR
eukprot:1190358-Prorocentrum_minimum.AAC.3